MTNKEKQELETLRRIVKDFHWMARRYADGRQTYATSMFNDHTRALLKMGVELNPTADGTIWARDAGGRSFDGLSDIEAALGETPMWEHRVHEEISKLREELVMLKLDTEGVEYQNLGASIAAQKLKEIAETGEHKGVFGGSDLEDAAQAILKLCEAAKGE